MPVEGGRQSTQRGCWTCRLRRKKCDEIRDEDQQCRTCRRLGIDCLGWGFVRPDWMKNKKAVEKYKIEMRAQLRDPTRRNKWATSSRSDSPSSASSFVNPSISGSSSACPTHQYEPPTLDTGLSSDPPTPCPRPLHPNAFQTAEPYPPEPEFIQYYYDYVFDGHFPNSGDVVRNAIASSIIVEPDGALLQSICALAGLNFSHVYASRNGVSPSCTSYHQKAVHYHRQVVSSFSAGAGTKSYTEGDAIGAILLIAFEVFSGTSNLWPLLLSVAVDWVRASGLLEAVDPQGVLAEMSCTAQFIVRKTMSMDIIASVTLNQPPMCLDLWRKLSGPNRCKDVGLGFELDLERVCAVPADILMSIAETTNLAHWKKTSMLTKSLSVVQLVAQGMEIERTILEKGFNSIGAGSLVFTGPALLHSSQEIGVDAWRASALVYLHGVLNDAGPGVPEVISSVGIAASLLDQLPFRNMEMSLVLPIALTASATDDLDLRMMLSERLRVHSVSRGKAVAQAWMETVWRLRERGEMWDMDAANMDLGQIVLLL